VQYFPFDWFRTRIEVRRGFGGQDGVVADVSADAIAPIWQRPTLSGGPRFTLQNSAGPGPSAVAIRTRSLRICEGRPGKQSGVFALRDLTRPLFQTAFSTTSTRSPTNGAQSRASHATSLTLCIKRIGDRT
jgi:hypothetical protein